MQLNMNCQPITILHTGLVFTSNPKMDEVLRGYRSDNSCKIWTYARKCVTGLVEGKEEELARQAIAKTYSFLKMN